MKDRKNRIVRAHRINELFVMPTTSAIDVNVIRRFSDETQNNFGLHLWALNAVVASSAADDRHHCEERSARATRIIACLICPRSVLSEPDMGMC